MRKIKSKNQIKINKQELYDKSILELEKLLNDETAFKVFMYFLNKEDNIYAVQMGIVLADITKYMGVKNREEKFKAGIIIKNNIMQLINHMFQQIIPTPNLIIFTALFELNEMITSYTKYDNRIVKALEKNSKANDYPLFREMLKENTGTLVLGDIEESLGYEPIFTGEIQNKFIDTLNWLPKTITRLMKYNPEFFIPSTFEKMLNEKYRGAQEAVSKVMNFSEESLKVNGKECELFIEMVARISLVSTTLKELEKSNKNILPLEYKSDMRHLKSTVSRLKTLFDMLYQLLEFGEIEGMVA